MAEHVRNDVKLGTALSHFFCDFFITVLQITVKSVMCLNKSITKHFMLAQKNLMDRLCTYVVYAKNCMFAFSKCLNSI